MVRDGPVTRNLDPEDGRLSRIYLTEPGRSLRDEMVPLALAVNVEILKRLTANEARTLRKLLAKLATHGGSPSNVPREELRFAFHESSFWDLVRKIALAVSYPAGRKGDDAPAVAGGRASA